MTKLTYRPKDGDPEVVTWGRIEFAAGVPTEAPEELVEKAKTNPHFDVEGHDKEALKAQSELERALKVRAGIEQEAMNIDDRQRAEIAEMEKRHAEEQDAFRHRTNNDFVWSVKVITEAKMKAHEQEAQQQEGNQQPKSGFDAAVVTGTATEPVVAVEPPPPAPEPSPAPQEDLAEEEPKQTAEEPQAEEKPPAFVDDADPTGGSL